MLSPSDKARLANLKTIRDKLSAELEVNLSALECDDVENNSYHRYIDYKKKEILKNFDDILELIRLSKKGWNYELSI